MVYGWGSEWFPRYLAFCEMKGVGHAPRGHPGVPRSMSLSEPYLRQEYIWFMGGDLNGFQDIMHFMKWRGWGMPPGDPLGSQDLCHLMCLIIRNKNIYGLGRVFWTLSKILCIFIFPHTNAFATKFNLGLKRSRSSQVTIYATYDRPTSQMKFHANRPSGSGEDFWRVFTIYGYDGHLGHMTWTPYANFRFPIPWRLHMKFDFNRLSGSRGEDVWKCEHTHTQTDNSLAIW